MADSVSDPGENELFLGPHRFELADWISCSPFESLLGIEILEADKGCSVLRMPFVLKLAQGGGLAHGGAMVTLADTAVAMAIKSIVSPGSRFGTIRMSSEFHAPVTKGFITARAKTKVMENRMIQGDAAVYDDENNKVMSFSAVFKLARDVRMLV